VDSAYGDFTLGQEHVHEFGAASTTSPSQNTIESDRYTHSSIDHGRNDSGLGTSIGPSTSLSVAGKEFHDVASESPGLDTLLAWAQEEQVPHTTNPFPDDAGTYVYGDGIMGQQAILDQAEDMAAIAVAVVDHSQMAPPKFPCTHVDLDTRKKCKTVCKKESALKYVTKPHSFPSTPKANTYLAENIVAPTTKRGRARKSVRNATNAFETQKTANDMSRPSTRKTKSPVQTAKRSSPGRMAWSAIGKATPLRLRRARLSLVSGVVDQHPRTRKRRPNLALDRRKASNLRLAVP
jgi:hypothetical protein